MILYTETCRTRVWVMRGICSDACAAEGALQLRGGMKQIVVKRSLDRGITNLL